MRDAQGRKYKVMANSTDNKRGTVILIAEDLNCDTVATYREQNDNVLMVLVNYQGKKLMLGSIYGPNNTSREFYSFLRQVLRTVEYDYTILGGDWNTVWDGNELPDNIDVLNMQTIPNIQNQVMLHNMANEFGLTDPYRAIKPNIREYSYCPFGTKRLIRSRLDFFWYQTAW